MTKQTDAPVTLTKAQRITYATENHRLALKAYNDEWKRDGTAKNYPNVDRKLDTLHAAERTLQLAQES